MGAQHSPAPWRVVAGREDELKVRGPADEFIADCADGFWSDEADGWVMAVESVPNARLIAASPDMVAALRLAERALLGAYGEPVEGASLQSTTGVAAIKAVRAAIAKAEGRS